MYLNLSLGRLTGEAKYWDMAEQTLYNHLLGAQSEDGRGWAYYLGLRDSKRFRWHTDPDCCPSRGTRALAQMPTHLFSITADGIAVNFYEPADAELPLPDGGTVRLAQTGRYPFDGAVDLAVNPETPSSFVVRLRIPGWCRSWDIQVNGEPVPSERDNSGYVLIDREWAQGDSVHIAFDMPARIVADADGNVGKVAFVRGPLVFAADSADLPSDRLLDDVIVALDPRAPGNGVDVTAGAENEPVHLSVNLASIEPVLGEGLWQVPERYHDVSARGRVAKDGSLRLVPFFLAGNRDERSYRDEIVYAKEPVTDVTFQVWLPYLYKES
jgi:DUF1680 family protein